VGLKRIQAIGRKNNQQAARLQDTMDFLERPGFVWNVLEDFIEQRQIERVDVELHGLDITTRNPFSEDGMLAAKSGNLFRLELHAIGVRSTFQEGQQILPPTASTIDDFPAP
jgi:hypothetical protein